jgi:hypothetical protein
MEPLQIETDAGLIAIIGMLGPSAHSEGHAIDKEGVGDVTDLAHLADGAHLNHRARFSNSQHAFGVPKPAVRTKTTYLSMWRIVNNRHFQVQ